MGPISITATKTAAQLLRDMADRMERAEDVPDMCVVVCGSYGGMTMVNTINNGLEAIGALQIGQRLLLDAIMPNPTLTEIESDHDD